MNVPSRILYGRLGLAFVGGLLCATLGWFNLLSSLDNMAYDTANELSLLPPPEDIVIVAIDERSLLELGRWPWPRERHVELIRIFREAGVKLAAIDVVFSEPDAEFPQVDDLLTEAVAAHGGIILPVFVGQADRGGQLLEIEPFPSLARSAARLGHVHIEVDKDGVARSVFLKEGLATPHWEHFSVAIGRFLDLPLDPLPGLSESSMDTQPSAVSIVRSHENLLRFIGPAGSVEMISYVDVLKRRVPDRILAEKLVFVGATAAGHADNVSTSLGQISGVEINANIFHALRLGKLAQRLSPETSALLSFVLCFCTILLFTRMRPRALLAAVAITILLVPLGSLVMLQGWQLWFSPAPVMLILLLAYPLWNWLRLDAAIDFMHEQLQALDLENRKSDFRWSWEHIEKAAKFLESLGCIRSWDISRDRPESETPEACWKHSGDQSSRWFRVNGEEGLLTLRWAAGHSQEVESLNLVLPDSNTEAQVPTFGGDIINVNIAELDLAYREARHSRELVSSTLNQLSNGVMLADGSGELRLLNQQARQLLALQDEQNTVLDALQRVKFSNNIDPRALLADLALRGIAFNEEGSTLDGGRDLLCRGRLIRLDRPMLLVSLTDVTDLKASERNRKEALNFLSHDLRAPLTSVLALIEGAKSENPDQLNLKLLENIERYIQNNLTYAENFTQLARLEQTEPPALDECDAQSLIDNAVALMFHAAKKRGIQFKLATSDEDIWLSCNRSVLERAILNLLDNALKHSPERGEVTVSLSGDSEWAYIEVTDRGGGIAAADTDRIFESFEQGSRPVSGVGLGLRFVAAAAQSHQGTITVDSQPGSGATFILKLPRLVQQLPG